VLLHLLAALLGERPHSPARASALRVELKAAAPPAQQQATLVRALLSGPRL
jgi:hypothetical protein